MEGFKYKIYSSGEHHPDLIKRLDEQVPEMIETLGKSIGAGKTAEVFFLPHDNTYYCYKVVCDQRMATLYNNISDRPQFNNLELESDFLEDARDPACIVRIPEPTGVWSGKTDSLGEFQVLVMEKLDAIPVQDIYYLQSQLPETFDIEVFGAELSRYISYLNDERGIHHRDISETNVMIDSKTGLPCIVDFGDSYKTLGEDDNPYRQLGIVSDKARIKELIKNLRNFVADKNRVLPAA